MQTCILSLMLPFKVNTKQSELPNVSVTVMNARRDRLIILTTLRTQTQPPPPILSVIGWNVVCYVLMASLSPKCCFDVYKPPVVPGDCAFSTVYFKSQLVDQREVLTMQERVAHL